MLENKEGQAIAPAPLSPSGSRARDPSSGVRITQQLREAVTDLGGLALAGYLASKGAITGLQALYFAVVLLLPSPVLLRIAKIIAARGGSAGAGVAVALLSASASWVHGKVYAVAGVGVLSLAACLAGCVRLPPSDRCGAGAVRCSLQGVPQLCDPQGRWTPMDEQCSRSNGQCCVTSAYSARRIALCLPREEACRGAH